MRKCILYSIILAPSKSYATLDVIRINQFGISSNGTSRTRREIREVKKKTVAKRHSCGGVIVFMLLQYIELGKTTKVASNLHGYMLSV